MARKVFFSFHYDPDKWRASQVRQMGVIEGDPLVRDNAWESVRKNDDAAIQRWINNQIDGRSCAVVLVGADTASRKWVRYEIIRAWNEKKGVVGIHVHNLLDENRQTSAKGANPFAGIDLGSTWLSSIAKLYDPAGADSKAVYATIAATIESWVEEAIRIRANYS